MAIKVNNVMIDMTATLENNCDLDWLPLEEREKVVEKQKG
jgi:hypothetical protein